MATQYSLQVADLKGGKADKLQPSELGGRIRVAYGRFITPPAGLQVGDVVEMVPVPKGARVLAIYNNNAPFSTGPGAAGADIGDADNPTRYATALFLDTFQSLFVPLDLDTGFQREPAHGHGYVYPHDSFITYRVTGEAWAGNAALQTIVYYVVD